MKSIPSDLLRSLCSTWKYKTGTSYVGESIISYSTTTLRFWGGCRINASYNHGDIVRIWNIGKLISRNRRPNRIFVFNLLLRLRVHGSIHTGAGHWIFEFFRYRQDRLARLLSQTWLMMPRTLAYSQVTYCFIKSSVCPSQRVQPLLSSFVERLACNIELLPG